jgi:hypothetical protein
VASPTSCPCFFFVHLHVNVQKKLTGGPGTRLPPPPYGGGGGLAELKKTLGNTIGQAIPTYVYDLNEKGISKTFVKYSSITEASSRVSPRARGTLGLYLDTNVPFKDKLYFSQPILDFEATFKLVKGLTKDLKLNNNNEAKGV